MQKIYFTAAICFFVFMSANGQNTLKITSGDQLSCGRKNITIENASEAGVFRIRGATALASRESIAVNPAKKYRLSGKFRNASPEKKALKISFGVNCRDARKQVLSGGMVNAVPGTETELAADFRGGGNVLKIKDASEWKKGKILVFKADPSGKLADLPNINTEYIAVKDIAANAERQYDVTMSRALKKSYPAGTSVRQHDHGQWYHLVILNTPLKEEWQEFTLEFSGESASGSEPGKWRRNTRFAGIAAYINPGQLKDAVTEFRDLKLEEVPE